MAEPVTVLLADDHALLRDMLGRRLAREGMEIVGSVDSGEAAEILGRDTKPDVALLDIDIPGKSIFEVARSIQEASPNTRIIFLSAFVQDQYIEQALAVEAYGYLTKTEPAENIAAGIRKAIGGATCFSADVLERIIISESGARLAGRHAKVDILTDREREVLGYIARGLQQKQIAALAGISIRTVQRHVIHVMDKLDIHDRVELAHFAIREGIVEP